MSNPLVAPKKSLRDYLPNFQNESITPELRGRLAPILNENTKFAWGWSLAGLALGGTTNEQFQAAHPGADIAALVADPYITRYVEMLSSRADIQDRALQAQTRRALRESVGVLSSKMQDPDCSPAMALSFGDQLIKIMAATEKRELSSGIDAESVRQMTIEMWGCSYTTPEGSGLIHLHDRQFDDCLAAIVWQIRCVNEREVDAVVDTLKNRSSLQMAWF